MLQQCCLEAKSAFVEKNNVLTGLGHILNNYNDTPQCRIRRMGNAKITQLCAHGAAAVPYRQSIPGSNMVLVPIATVHTRVCNNMQLKRLGMFAAGVLDYQP